MAGAKSWTRADRRLHGALSSDYQGAKVSWLARLQAEMSSIPDNAGDLVEELTRCVAEGKWGNE